MIKVDYAVAQALLRAKPTLKPDQTCYLLGVKPTHVFGYYFCNHALQGNEFAVGLKVIGLYEQDHAHLSIKDGQLYHQSTLQ
jgi:hypothetical protein